MLAKGIFYFLVAYIILYFIFANIPEEIGWIVLYIVVFAVPVYVLLKIVQLIMLTIRKGKYNKRVEEFALLLEEKCNKLGMFSIQEIFDEVKTCPRSVKLLTYLCEKINYPYYHRDYVKEYISAFYAEKRLEIKCSITDENGKKAGALYQAVNADVHASNMLPSVVLQID